MKSLVESIINEDNKWSIDTNSTTPKSLPVMNGVKYIFINTDSQYIKFYSQDQLESDLEEFDQMDMLDDIQKLKVGESFDADGGFSIYVRVAK